MKSLIYIAVLPVLLLLIYIYSKDEHKEPTNILIRTFFLGVATIIPAVILELILGKFFPTNYYRSIIGLFINVLIGIALVEELFKWLVIKVSIYKDKNFDESYDGIIYAVFASLGFACLENILYVITSGFTTGILRAITAVPLHACTGIIMGYFIGKAKLCNNSNNSSKEMWYINLSLALPTTIHAIYDFLLFTSRLEYIITWVIFTLGIYILCFFIIKKSTKENHSIIERSININNTTQDNYCRYCGKRINNSNYCPYCGNKNK